MSLNVTHPLKSDHDNLNNSQISVWIFLESNLKRVLLWIMLAIVSAHLEGSEREFDDFGVFHCSGAHSFVGLVLTAGQICVNVKILD